MFKKNPAAKQLSIDDPIFSFPGYVQEMLKNSWAEYFFHNIFSKIDEERFNSLYSTNYSRPNAPVNILVGLLILKELNHLNDEELIASLYFDYRVRYALGIVDFDKERICINTLSNFRKRLYQDSADNNRDLLKEEVKNLTENLVKLTGMDTSLARQDSMMISANAKKMGRLELIYTVNQAVVKLLDQHKLVPGELENYLQKKDKAEQVYRLKKEEVEQRTEFLLKDSLLLYDIVPGHLKDSKAYLNLTRLLEEHTDHLSPKDPKDIQSSSMQNPHEPEATYRVKGKRGHVGYTTNLVEARDRRKGLSMIVHYEKQPNITSDVQFGLNSIKELQGISILANDGAYYSTEMVKEASEKKIELSFSALNGRPPDQDKLPSSQFRIEPETELITACPNGKVPVNAAKKKDCYTAKFDKKDCSACPHLERCIVKEQKRYFMVRITEKQYIADTCRSLFGTERHRALADFRAGVEGVPSVLRRVYGIDKIPVRGLIRSRIWDHGKMMAYNFKSFFQYCRINGVSAPSCSFISIAFQRFIRYFRLNGVTDLKFA